MLAKTDISNKLKELKQTLYKEYVVKEIGLFGSFSEETFNGESDIDILVKLERPVGWKYFSLELYLEKIFNRKIDRITKNVLKDQIKDRILKQINYI